MMDTRTADVGGWAVDVASRTLLVPSLVDNITGLLSVHCHFGADCLLNIQEQYDLDNGTQVRFSELDLARLAKIDHELDHLQRSVGTSFGQLLHAIQSRQVHLMCSELAELSPGEAIALPLYKRDVSNERSRRQSGLAQLEAMLVCASTSTRPPDVALDQEAVRQLEEVCPGIATPEYLDTPVVPQFGPLGMRQGRLGAAGVLETLALTREASLLRAARIEDGFRQAVIHEMMRLSIYAQCHNLWVTRFPQRVVSHDLRDSAYWAQRDLIAHDGLPFEFFASAELALWPPVGPEGVLPAGNDGRVEWRDIQPGWRLVRILDCLQSEGIRLTPIHRPNEAMDQKLGVFQNSVCSQLGWATPDDISSAWVNYLTAQKNDSRASARRFGDDSARDVASVEAFQARVERPWKTSQAWPRPHGQTHRWFAAAVQEKRRNGRVEHYTVHAMTEDGSARLPTAYVMRQFLALFGFMRSREELSYVKRIYSAHGKRFEAQVAEYLHKHYGTGLEFGRGPVP